MGCNECHGSGVVQCHECNGEKTVTCNRCGGKGSHACSKCEGSGIVECAKCSGEGKIYEVCPSCDKGKVTRSRTKKCSTCHGTGMMTKVCPVCDCGYVEEFEWVNCETCHGKGVRYYNGDAHECCYCNGRGQVREYYKKICPNCHGDWENVQTTCTSCDGSGEEETFVSVVCPKCKGKYKISSEICSSCNGTGEKKCGTCHGTGIEKCIQCEGDGRVKCETCNGSGKLACKTCQQREEEARKKSLRRCMRAEKRRARFKKFCKVVVQGCLGWLAAYGICNAVKRGVFSSICLENAAFLIVLAGVIWCVRALIHDYRENGFMCGTGGLLFDAVIAFAMLWGRWLLDAVFPGVVTPDKWQIVTAVASFVGIVIVVRTIIHIYEIKTWWHSALALLLGCCTVVMFVTEHWYASVMLLLVWSSLVRFIRRQR